MVFGAYPMVYEMKPPGAETKTMASGINTFVSAAKSMIAGIRKMGGAAKTMDRVTASMALGTPPPVLMPRTTVAVLKKIVPVAPAMVFVLLSIAYLISGQSFATLRLVVF